MNKTALYDSHIKSGGNIVEFAGYLMPVVYSSIIKEHLSVREKAGVFDISHMGQIFVNGAGAKEYIDTVFPSRTLKLQNESVQYSVLLNEDGGIVDDLLIYQISADNSYLLLVNAANISKDYNYLIHLKEKLSLQAEIINRSDDYSMIAIQGPESIKKVSEIFPEASDMKYYNFGNFIFKDSDIIISRTGYTGEEGFEIIADSSAIIDLWELFISRGVQPVGLGARDSLRLECCFSLYGHELSEDINPFQAGISFVIDKDKTTHYAFDKLFSSDNTDLIRAFKVEGRGIARAGDKIYRDDEEVGIVTSGSYLPSLKAAGGLLLFNREYPDDSFIVKIRKKAVNIQIMNKPLILPFNRR